MQFNREIRPILAANCFACHGPDEDKRQADLRLDTHEGALADLGGHAAIVPGKPEASELVRRISSDDPDERMPPAESGKNVSPSPDRAGAALDRRRRQVAGALGRRRRSPGRNCRRPRRRQAATNPIDPFVRRSWRSTVWRLARGRPRHAGPPAVVRPDWACRPRRKKSTRSSADTSARRLREAGRPAAWPRRTTASGWPCTGSTWCAIADTNGYPRRQPSRHRPVSRLRDSTRSTTTCRSTASRSSNWPATCCPTPRASSRSPRATTGC